MARLSIIAAEPPSAAPEFVGQHYVDTVSGVVYHATGTASVNDWDAGGGGGGALNQSAVTVAGPPVAGAVTVDVADGFAQTLTVEANTTITVADPPAAGYWQFRLQVPAGGFVSDPGWLISWDSETGLIAAADAGQDAYTGMAVVYEVYTFNGGANWHYKVLRQLPFPPN